MKKLLLFPFLFIAFNAFSQLQKGQWLTGGYADFLYSGNHQKVKNSTSDYTSTTLQTSLNGGYFILDKLSVGLTGGIVLSNSDKSTESTSQIGHISNSSSENTFGYVIGPFIKYYLLPTQNKLNIFIDFSYGYSHNKQKTETNQSIEKPYDPAMPGRPITAGHSEENQKVDANIFALSLGPAFFITKRSSLELGLGYSYIDYMKSKNSSHNFSASLGFQIFLGK